VFAIIPLGDEHDGSALFFSLPFLLNAVECQNFTPVVIKHVEDLVWALSWKQNKTSQHCPSVFVACALPTLSTLSGSKLPATLLKSQDSQLRDKRNISEGKKEPLWHPANLPLGVF